MQPNSLSLPHAERAVLLCRPFDSGKIALLVVTLGETMTTVNMSDINVLGTSQVSGLGTTLRHTLMSATAFKHMVEDMAETWCRHTLHGGCSRPLWRPSQTPSTST